jgi:hypothetical protein
MTDNHDGCGEHCGIFTIPGEIPILGAYRDICYVPLRGNIWTASEGIYRTCFVEGEKGVVAFDTFGTPGTARAYGGAIQRVFPDKPVHTIVYSHDHLPMPISSPTISASRSLSAAAPTGRKRPTKSGTASAGTSTSMAAGSS